MKLQAVAHVNHWNATSCTVTCPFCKRSHHHARLDPRDGYEERRIKIAGCDSWLRYAIQYPFTLQTDPPLLWFEIDKVMGRYFDVDWAACFPRSSDGMTGQTQSTCVSAADSPSAGTLESSNDDLEEISGLVFVQGTLKNRAVKLFMMIQRCGALTEILAEMHSLVKAQLLKLKERWNSGASGLPLVEQARWDLMNVADADGNTVLHHVAIIGGTLDVDTLKSQKFSLHSRQNKAGNSPLAEAVLRGHLDIAAKFLASETVDSLIGANRDGKTVLELVNEMLPPDESDRLGHLQLELLGRIRRKLNVKEYVPRSMEERINNTHSIHDRCGHLDPHLIGSSCDFSTSLPQLPKHRTLKNVARVIREGPLPSIELISGWSDHATGTAGKPKASILQIEALCAKLQIPLASWPWDTQQKHSRGAGRKGRYHASHVEKQAVMQLLLRHVFLPWEKDVSHPLYQLWMTRPPILLPEYIIAISTGPCKDCRSFVREVVRGVPELGGVGGRMFWRWEGRRGGVDGRDEKGRAGGAEGLELERKRKRKLVHYISSD